MTTFAYKLIDLTHTLHGDIPTWAGSCGFKQTRVHEYDPAQDYQFRIHTIEMNEGIGTHMDAPAHCCPGGKTIDQLSLEELVVPCIVIDVSAAAHERYSVSVQDIQKFEADHGEIAAGSFVMVRTGWDQFWQQPEQYRNNLLFPSVSTEAAQELLKRNVVGIGIDTLSPDREEDGFPVHKLFLEAGKYMIENVANLENLPVTGAYIAALPLKTKGGTEAPVRLIGLVS